MRRSTRGKPGTGQVWAAAQNDGESRFPRGYACSWHSPVSITDQTQLLFALIAMALLTNACFLPPWVLHQSHEGPGKLVLWTARGFWSPGKLMACVSPCLKITLLSVFSSAGAHTRTWVPGSVCEPVCASSLLACGWCGQLSACLGSACSHGTCGHYLYFCSIRLVCAQLHLRRYTCEDTGV